MQLKTPMLALTYLTVTDAAQQMKESEGLTTGQLSFYPQEYTDTDRQEKAINYPKSFMNNPFRSHEEVPTHDVSFDESHGLDPDVNVSHLKDDNKKTGKVQQAWKQVKKPITYVNQKFKGWGSNKSNGIDPDGDESNLKDDNKKTRKDQQAWKQAWKQVKKQVKKPFTYVKKQVKKPFTYMKKKINGRGSNMTNGENQVENA